MNFEKIDIYGFKSFADKVEIKFEPGITAIVGPNGCGKSNVADSIRFVMGEQSAKSMRGSSMLDVIFNGTEKRKAQSYCEVSLYFDNSKKIFDLDYDEVILTRKLYKNGDSEYLINKNVCRRKDIIEAFRNIGLGKESYCVIGQGKIDSILSAKPEDRRNVFEEAAGISKFKEDKNQSENKLVRVNENLTRINDIIAELEKQLGPLKAQAENAKLFLELSNRLKELEINIYVYQYDNASGEKQKIYDVIKSIEEELALKQAEFEKAVKDYEINQTEIASIDDTISELRDELLNLTVALEKQNGEIKLANEKISIIKEQNEKLTTRIEQGKFVQNKNSEQILKLQNDKKEYEKLLFEDETEQKVLEQNYKLTLEKLSIGEADAESYESELYSSLERSGDIKSALSKFQAEETSLSERKNDVMILLNNLEKEQSEIESKKSSAENSTRELKEEILKAKSKKQKIYDNINEYNQQFNEIDETLDEKKAKFHTDSSRLNLLKEMKEYNEGFNVSVKRLIEQAKSGTSVGGKVIGVVASLMKVPSHLEVAIEMALGASVQNIVTKNEEDAKDLINYLKVNKFGRVTFLPVTSMKERYVSSTVQSKLNMRGVLGIASDLIEFDSKYSNVFKSLLGSTVIIDNMDNAIQFSKLTGYQAKIVTLDGDIINPQGSMTGGSRKDSGSNLLGRDREIETLTASLKNLKVEIEDLTKKEEELKTLSENESAELEKLIAEIHTDEMGVAKYEELILTIEEQLKEVQAEIIEQKVNLSAIQDKQNFVSSQIEQISAELGDANTKKSRASESKKQANDNFGKLRSQRDEIFEKLSELKVKIENDRNNLNNANIEIERISISSAENEYQTKEALLEVQKNNSELEKYEKLVAEIMQTSSFSTSSKQVDEVRQKIAEFTEKKRQSQELMNRADGNKMLLAGEIQRASDKKAKEESLIVKIDTDIEYLQNRVWEEYELTYGDAKKLALADFDIKAGQEECSEVKRKIQRLGNVNVAAIEDIKSVSERYNDLSSQRDDLVKAQEDLRIIIKDLTTKMETQFSECFNTIRSHFQVIYKELFGGGRADICLDDENNVLECGIDVIAEPPGKKLQNITLLSGGEKALTAVAILFSILKLRPMPFCVLDEIEAALDDANVARYAKYLHKYTGDTQFIVITHRKPTMELADALYGVTMEEKGVSKVVSVKLADAIKIDNSAN